MNISKNKSLTTITLALILTIATLMASLPITSAHDPPTEQTTYAFIEVAPNPIGVEQTAFVIMWLDKVPPTAWGVGGERWEGFEVEITAPNGDTETKGPYTSDPTSAAWFLYTPNQIGEYTFYFTFPGQVVDLFGPTGIPGFPSAFIDDPFLPSSATAILTVTDDQVTEPPHYPLPSEYWTRPIEGQNTEWVRLASNWLGWGSGQIVGGGNWGGGGVQPTGAAPGSPHIMWTKPLQDGGVVGGDYSISGATYYTGLSYEGRYNDPLIIYGRLYYDTPLGNNPNDGPYICVDLRTGETLWENDDISPSFGQLYLYESMNQHGVIGDGYLWQTVGNTLMAFDSRTGKWLFNMTDVPSGTPAYGKSGELLRYVLNYGDRTLALWNSSAGPDSPLVLTPGTSSDAYQYRPIGKNADMSDSYSWTVSIPDLPGLGSPAIFSVIPGDLILGTSTNFASFIFNWGTPNPYTFWAISLKPESRGQLLWIENYTAPGANQTLVFMGAPNVVNRNIQIDAVSRVFFVTVKETSQWYGYDLDTGEMLWGPRGNFRSYQYYGTTSNPPAPGYVYNGKFYVAGYGGELHCFNSRTGLTEWVYNNTNSGTQTPWGNYPLFVSTFADGKIYLFSGEHSPNVPPYKGSRIRCLDASSGDELWTMLSWFAGGGFGQWGAPIADGYYTYLNVYDMQVYCVGKGPSATTVTIQDDSISLGESVLIKGTITDECAGAKQLVEDGKFKFVPAVADRDMGKWMEYLYMQKPCPEDVAGVQVKLTAVDSTGAEEFIGTVTCDAYGMFKKMWTPQSEGEYSIIATFEGTESYYYSYAETAVGVGPEPDPYPEAPTASEVAQATISRLPAYPEAPSASEVAQETISRLPAYPEPTVVPEYTIVDIVIIVLVIAGIVIGLYAIIRKQK